MPPLGMPGILIALAVAVGLMALARLVPNTRPWVGVVLLLGGSALAGYGITSRPSQGAAIGIGFIIGFAGLGTHFWPLLRGSSSDTAPTTPEPEAPAITQP